MKMLKIIEFNINSKKIFLYCFYRSWLCLGIYFYLFSYWRSPLFNFGDIRFYNSWVHNFEVHRFEITTAEGWEPLIVHEGNEGHAQIVRGIFSPPSCPNKAHTNDSCIRPLTPPAMAAFVPSPVTTRDTSYKVCVTWRHDDKSFYIRGGLLQWYSLFGLARFIGTAGDVRLLRVS